MAEKMPSSVRLGSRPISSRIRWYSSEVRPCSATSCGVMRGSLGIIGRKCAPSARIDLGFSLIYPFGPRGGRGTGEDYECACGRRDATAPFDFSAETGSRAQRPFRHGDPLGLRPADISWGALELRQHFCEQGLGLDLAAHFVEQEAITDAGFGAG